MICLLFYSSRQTNQICSFVFLENLWLANLLFEINWPLKPFGLHPPSRDNIYGLPLFWGDGNRASVIYGFVNGQQQTWQPLCTVLAHSLLYTLNLLGYYYCLNSFKWESELNTKNPFRSMSTIQRNCHTKEFQNPHIKRPISSLRTFFALLDRSLWPVMSE